MLHLNEKKKGGCCLLAIIGHRFFKEPNKIPNGSEKASLLLTDLDKAIEDEIKAYNINLNSTKSLIRKKLQKSTKFDKSKKQTTTKLSKIENKIKYENLSDKVPEDNTQSPSVITTQIVVKEEEEEVVVVPDSEPIKSKVEDKLEIEKISIISTTKTEEIEDKVALASNSMSLTSLAVNEEDLSIKKKIKKGNPFLKGLFRANENVSMQQQQVLIGSSNSAAAAAANTITTNTPSLISELNDILYIKIDLDIDANNDDYITLILLFQKSHFDNNEKSKNDTKSKMKKNGSFQSLIFKKRGKKRIEREEHQAIEAEDQTNISKEKLGFCFGLMQQQHPQQGSGSGCGDESDEEIEVASEVSMTSNVPHGLVGLQNLGNTCYLNAAIQCIRCTPGFAEMIVPELKEYYNNFDCVEKEEANSPKQNNNNGFSISKRPSSLPDISDEECVLISRQKSLPGRLPCEIGGLLTVGPGLAGGSIVTRIASFPVLKRPLPHDHHQNLDMFLDKHISFQNVTDINGDNKVDLNCKDGGKVELENSETEVTLKKDASKINEKDDCKIDSTAVLGPDGSAEVQDTVLADKPNNEINSKEDTSIKETEISSVKKEENEISNVKKEENEISNVKKEENEISSVKKEENEISSVKKEENEISSVKKEENEISSVKKEENEISNAKNEENEISSVKKEENEISSVKKGNEVKNEKLDIKKFSEIFKKLIMDVYTGKSYSYINPKAMLDSLKKTPQGEIFRDGGQHDCQEAFKVLLDTIQDIYKYDNPDVIVPTREEKSELELIECCNIEKSNNCEENSEMPYLNVTPSIESDPARDEAFEAEIKKADDMWAACLEYDCNPLTKLFVGQLQIVRICQKCQTRKTTYEPFWDLALPLAGGKSGWFSGHRIPTTIDDLLRAFTTSEIMQKEDAPYCETCEQKSSATRRITIHRFPQVLVLNIKRFKYTRHGREKLTDRVCFPLKSLHINNYASEESKIEKKSVVYDLYAVSNHYGTLGGGHYTACCKVKDKSGKPGWYCFNDKLVTSVTQDAVVSANAYILFYNQRP